ncbi:helix-turn-helix transcriptional regulator [Brevibacillus centrosporus]|uniref:helix-turn-helix transcriptional regulator n=1 Tax=Brevibacillus centrosporus TaxID=54910 RepID=UPI002E24A4D6|nr:helix-turn-helix transcriptional regulator [Brevibacillus centrosporus]
MATTLICPSCAKNMQEKRKNLFVCGCGSTFRQMVIDIRPIRHKIIEARKRAGLEQVTVAKLLNITYLHYQRIESGSVNLATKNKHRLAKIFGCGVGDLDD